MCPVAKRVPNYDPGTKLRAITHHLLTKGKADKVKNEEVAAKAAKCDLFKARVVDLEQQLQGTQTALRDTRVKYNSVAARLDKLIRIRRREESSYHFDYLLRQRKADELLRKVRLSQDEISATAASFAATLAKACADNVDELNKSIKGSLQLDDADDGSPKGKTRRNNPSSA